MVKLRLFLFTLLTISFISFASAATCSTIPAVCISSSSGIGQINSSDYWGNLYKTVGTNFYGFTCGAGTFFSGVLGNGTPVCSVAQIGTYNATYALWSYNQTTPAVSSLNNSYGKFWYNQTYSGSTYNSTYATWAYNQTTPAVSSLNSSYGKFWYNMTTGTGGPWASSGQAITNSTVQTFSIGSGTHDSNIMMTSLPIGFNPESASKYYPIVASKYYPSSSITGMLVIGLPTNWSNTDIRFTVLGNDYNTPGAWEILVSGYNWATGPRWVYPNAIITGSPPSTLVRFAGNGTRNLIILGNATTVWTYPALTITNLQTSLSSPNNWGTNWTLTNTTDESGFLNMTTGTSKVLDSPWQKTNTYVFNNTAGVNFGLGTNTPSYKLTTQSTTNNYGIAHTDGTVTLSTYISTSSPAGGWLGTITNHNLHFYVNNGNPSMTLNATTSNFGIGALTPSQKLEVNGSIKLSKDNDGLVLGAASDWVSKVNSTGFYLDRQAGSTNLSIPSGIVGIGRVNTANAKLQVYNANANDIRGAILGQDFMINSSTYGSFGANTRVGAVGSAYISAMPNLTVNSFGTQYVSVGLVGLGSGSGGGGSAHGIGVYGLGQGGGSQTGLIAGGKFEANSRTLITNAFENFYGVYSLANASTNENFSSVDKAYGIYSEARGTFNDTTYGGYFVGRGGLTNYGVYSEAGSNYFAGQTTIANLTGTGNDYVCVNATGTLYRSDAACV